MNKQDEIDRLKEVLNDAQGILKDVTQKLDDLEEKHKAEKWEPRDGSFYVRPEGVYYGYPTEEHQCYGTKFQTGAQAEEGYKNFRAYHRCYQAWLEIVGDWRPDWSDDSQKKYYSYHNGCFLVNHFTYLVRYAASHYFKTPEQTKKFIGMVEEDLLILAGVK